jgi:hypothetical protein
MLRTLGLLAALLWPLSASAQLDAESLLSHVRPERRDGLASELEVGSVSELPGYDLHLSIAEDLHGFGLRETIEVTNREDAPLRDVVLRIFINATPPEGMTPQVTLAAGRCPASACAVSQPSPTVIRVVPDAPIAPGARLSIELDLTGRLEAIDPERTGMLAQGLEGMSAFESGGGGHGYGLLAHDGTTASLAAFFPVLARRGARGWITEDHGTTGDLGTDAMANVRARVVVPRGFVVAATGETARRRGVRDGDGPPSRDEVTIHAGAIRDFALVVGATLVTMERDVGGVAVRSIFVPEHREAGQAVLEHAAAALEIFERRFGPYPYTALDVVEAPLVGGAGGVEFSSLVTVASMFYGGADEGLGALAGLVGAFGGDDAMLSNAGDMTASMREFVTAHEVAHQWWHGIVGSDSREHPVTDESLAQWSAVLYVEERHGSERAAAEAERQVAMNYVMMRVNGLPDAAADQPASAFDPPVAYAGIVYGKAPYLWMRLRVLLGDEAFFAGVTEYVRRYRMRIAPPDGLLEILAGAADRTTAREIRRLGRRWLRERHGDEDLGPISEDRMLGSMLGVEASSLGESAGPMRMMMRMMMGSGGGLEGLEGLDPSMLEGLLGGGLGGDMDPEALRGMLGDALDEGGLGGMDPSEATELLEGMGASEEAEARPRRGRSRGPSRVE